MWINSLEKNKWYLDAQKLKQDQLLCEHLKFVSRHTAKRGGARSLTFLKNLFRRLLLLLFKTLLKNLNEHFVYSDRAPSTVMNEEEPI